MHSHDGPSEERREAVKFCLTWDGLRGVVGTVGARPVNSLKVDVLVCRPAQHPDNM